MRGSTIPRVVRAPRVRAPRVRAPRGAARGPRPAATDVYAREKFSTAWDSSCLTAATDSNGAAAHHRIHQQHCLRSGGL